MALPQDDPSLPSNPAPLFSDTDAVRGDHQRANNQYIWENFEYLNDGENINDADAATPVDADRLGFWQIVGGIIKYVTFANLFLWIGTKIAALSTKGTPVDADSVVIVDSENSNVLKRVLFSALKAFFKTYFDTLYVAIVPQCEWRADGFNGYGSTNDKIPTFTNVRVNVDTAGAVTIDNSATLGCSVTINVAGYYTFNFGMNFSANSWFGLSLNSNQLTTSIVSIDAEDRLAQAFASDRQAHVSARLYCAANDVIRPHTDGTNADTAERVVFSVTRG